MNYEVWSLIKGEGQDVSRPILRLQCSPAFLDTSWTLCLPIYFDPFKPLDLCTGLSQRSETHNQLFLLHQVLLRTKLCFPAEVDSSRRFESVEEFRTEAAAKGLFRNSLNGSETISISKCEDYWCWRAASMWLVWFKSVFSTLCSAFCSLLLEKSSDWIYSNTMHDWGEGQHFVLQGSFRCEHSSFK